jgi:hypothetical protein
MGLMGRYAEELEGCSREGIVLMDDGSHLLLSIWISRIWLWVLAFNIYPIWKDGSHDLLFGFLIRLFLIHLRVGFELCVVVWFVIAYNCFIV